MKERPESLLDRDGRSAPPTPVETLVFLMNGPIVHASDREVQAVLQARWASIVEEAIRHEVEPALHARLADSAWGHRAPDEMIDRLAELYALNALKSRVRSQELSGLLGKFRSGCIDVIVLKGAYLSEVVYEDRALRPMADLDFLVRRSDLGRVVEMLEGEGYTSDDEIDLTDSSELLHHLPPFRKPGASMIEIHWTLEDPQRALTFDIDGIWARSQPVTIGAQPTLGLGPEDLILHLCLHVSYHHRFGTGAAVDGNGPALKHLRDIALVIDEFGHAIDPSSLARLAEAMKASRYVAVTLRLVEALTEGSIPDGWIQEIGGSADDDEIVEKLLEFFLVDRTRGNEDREEEVDLPEWYTRLNQADGFGSRVKSFFRAVVPPPPALQDIYGLERGGVRLVPFYLWRPFDLLGRYSQDVLRMVRGSEGVRDRMSQERTRGEIRGWLED